MQTTRINTPDPNNFSRDVIKTEVLGIAECATITGYKRTDWAIQASWEMYKRRTKMEIIIMVIPFTVGIMWLIVRYATI